MTRGRTTRASRASRASPPRVRSIRRRAMPAILRELRRYSMLSKQRQPARRGVATMTPRNFVATRRLQESPKTSVSISPRDH